MRSRGWPAARNASCAGGCTSAATAPRPRRFAGALEHAAAEVEDLYKVRVEVVTVGDRQLDESLLATVSATREAMINAAKFAGEDEIDLYAEVGEDGVQVFVRDRGVGFDLATAIPGIARASGTRSSSGCASTGARPRFAPTPGERNRGGAVDAAREPMTRAADPCRRWSTTTACFAPGVRADLGARIEIVGEAGVGRRRGRR